MNDFADPRNLYPRPPYSNKPQPMPGFETSMDPTTDHGEKSYVGTGKLEGRSALITGADSGIGRAVALAFAREGADIVISYLSEHDDANETARHVREAGRRAVLVPGDLRTREGCQAVAQEAVKGLAGIDILVNNAAFQSTHDELSDFPDEEFEKTFQINVFALFRLSKALLPQMSAGSSIINTGSIQSFDPSTNLLAYAATKAAIVSLTRSMAGMAMKHGVRVNAVAPGPVWTPLIPSTMPREKVKNFGADTIFGRAAQPAEVAPVFVFLASAAASFVTGEVYGVTGGQTPI